MSNRSTPETDAEVGYFDLETAVSADFARRLERERDWTIEKFKLLEGCFKRAEQERDEAQNKLSQIYRWIERNHADGFIDSLTFLQNFERVTDCWHDRIDRIEMDARRFVKERDEARGKLENEMKWHHQTHQELIAAQCKLLDIEYDKLKS